MSDAATPSDAGDKRPDRDEPARSDHPGRTNRAWIPFALAVLSGALHFLSFCGFGIWPLAFVCFLPLFFALEHPSVKTARRAAAVGFTHGFVAYAGGYHWMAKMLEGGEDPRFIARRLVILASEDVGLADARALPIAVAAHHACDFVGLPECRYNLAHATVFLATAPKSNSANLALAAATNAIRNEPIQSVPIHLRDTGGQASKRMGHGEGYRYSHDFEEAVAGQDYMTDPKTFYRPIQSGEEATIAERLAHWRELRKRIES